MNYPHELLKEKYYTQQSNTAMNNNIRTVMVMPFSTAILCGGNFYRRECRNYTSFPYSLSSQQLGNPLAAFGIYLDIYFRDPVWIRNGVNSLRIWENDFTITTDYPFWQPSLWTTTDFTIFNQDSKELGHVYTSISHWHDVDVNEFQGVAHNPKTNYWYFTTNHKLRKIHISEDLESPYVAYYVEQKQGHWGDPDFYYNKLYVPNYNKDDRTRPAYIDVFIDDSGKLTKRDRFYLGDTPEAGWVAINPRNGRLYTSYVWDTIQEYSLNKAEFSYSVLGEPYARKIRDISIDLESMAFVSGAGSKDAHDAHWYLSKNPHCQGGAFSDSGHFYYVYDLREDNRAYTGTYVFEIDYSEKKNIATAKRFIPNSYDGVWDGGYGAKWELEGIDIWDLEQVQERHNRLGHQIHLIKIKNQWTYEDRVNFYHMPVDDPSKL